MLYNLSKPKKDGQEKLRKTTGVPELNKEKVLFLNKMKGGMGRITYFLLLQTNAATKKGKLLVLLTQLAQIVK